VVSHPDHLSVWYVTLTGVPNVPLKDMRVMKVDFWQYFGLTNFHMSQFELKLRRIGLKIGGNIHPCTIQSCRTFHDVG